MQIHNSVSMWAPQQLNQELSLQLSPDCGIHSPTVQPWLASVVENGPNSAEIWSANVVESQGVGGAHAGGGCLRVEGEGVIGGGTLWEGHQRWQRLQWRGRVGKGGVSWISEWTSVWINSWHEQIWEGMCDLWKCCYNATWRNQKSLSSISEGADEHWFCFQTFSENLKEGHLQSSLFPQFNPAPISVATLFRCIPTDTRISATKGGNF